MWLLKDKCRRIQRMKFPPDPQSGNLQEFPATLSHIKKAVNNLTAF